MSQVDVEEQLRALREQALRRETPLDAWPRLLRRLRREPRRRAALVGVLAMAILVAGVVPGLLTRRAQLAPAVSIDTRVAAGHPVVSARIRLDRPFTDVDVGYGAVWLATRGVLMRIDPGTNRVVATIPTPLTDRSASIGFGEGSVWATSGSGPQGVVYRVDPVTNRVTATIQVPGGAFGIVVEAGTAWVTQRDPQPGPGPGVVARIDARSGRLLSPVQVPSMPITIRSGLDAVWVTSAWRPSPSPESGGVSRIDPRTGNVTARLGSVDNVMAVGAGALWGTFANNAKDSGVKRVDPATGRVVATITIPNGVVMAFGLGTLWVAQDAASTSGGGESAPPEPGKLYRIDPASNRALGRPVPLPGIAPTALAVGEGAVWVGELDRTTLTRFNLVA